MPTVSPGQLSACDLEPIHAPGGIQPHGALLVTAPGSTRISHVSANCEAWTGLEPGRVIGAELRSVVGGEVYSAIDRGFDSGAYTPSNVLHIDGQGLVSDLSRKIDQFQTAGMGASQPSRDARLASDASGIFFASGLGRTLVAHRHDGRIFLEIEEDNKAGKQANMLAEAHVLLGSLREARTVEELCDVAVRKIRRLIDYDRVMIYRFDGAGNGTVVAEDKLDLLEPFLGLCYPATDIPQQARRLYIQQRVRVIPDVAATPVGMLSAPEEDAAPLDMSFCSMRAVSPVHLEYMQNMEVCATLVASLLRDGALWGMIVCHHGQPRTPAAEIRSLLDVVSQLMSLLIQKTEEACALADKLGRSSYITALRFDSEASESVATVLAGSGRALLDLVGAAGALIRFGGQVNLIGSTPPRAEAIAIVDALRAGRTGEMIVVSDAGKTGAPASSCAATASGILVVPVLNNPDDALVFFRPELVRTVRWAGKPAEPKAADPFGRLSPRHSFREWCEIVRGCSAPWSDVDVQTAGELRRTIADGLLRQAEAKLAQLSAYDPLTVLANRRTIKSLIDRFHAERTVAHAALLFFDLDQFKSINDTFGHAAGDQVLIQTAMRLRQEVPEGATPGRLGGDEFVVFWPGASQAEAERLAQSLLRALSQPFILDHQRYQTTASVGLACSDIRGADHLLREADEAMYVAKRQGGGQVVLFEPTLHDRIVSAVAIEQDLFQAIDNNELEVHYQPIVAVPSRKISGFEALVRWHHSVRGWIPPSEFIPRAEGRGMIVRLGAFVFRSAVQQIARWRADHGALTVSVNVSARQLNEGSFTNFAINTVTDAGLPPAAICIEVTESALMDETAVRELHHLRKAGFQVAVDDFGTGYSSLSYLQRLPVDGTKIDRAFVQPSGSDERANRFLASIVTLVHTLGLQAVAEGCETEEQWEAICAANCDRAQGWLVSKARPPSEIDALLAMEG